MSDLGDKLKPCPFCNGKMKFFKHTYINKYGKKVTEQYYMHEKEDSNCILDELIMPLVIGAGDADEESGYIGEYAEKWNNRTPTDDLLGESEEQNADT